MPENYSNQTISTVNLSTRSPFDAHVLNKFHKLIHKLMWITSEWILRSSSIVTNNWKQGGKLVKMLVYIIPLKQPNGIRGRPAVFETHSCPDAWVIINKVSKMRMNLRDQITFIIRKPLFGNGGFIRLDTSSWTNRSDGEEILSGEALEDTQEQLFRKRQQRDGRRTLSYPLPDRQRETFGTSTVEH